MQLEFKGRLHLIGRPFAEMKEALDELGVSQVDGVVFDLGVSSMQLDQAERGFSFRQAGPLSMRMDSGKPDAADVIAKADVDELAAVFRVYGEERHAKRIARAIVVAREAGPVDTTTSLAALIEKVAPRAPKSKIHAATRVFQGLRIFVNDELGQLVAGLRAAETLLYPTGRLVVVSFQSLDDRIVKRFLMNGAARRQTVSRYTPPLEKINASFELVSNKAVDALASEVSINPRARSAKLRAAIRTKAPPIAVTDMALGLPRPLDLKFMQEGRT
jgi:16S rRNA (cytosine1402-N4)-methyltransferase